MASHRLSLGAPGVYTVAPTTTPALAGVRLDACAFVGVAPRGPAWEPVRDASWRIDQPTIGPGRTRRRCVAVPVTSFGEYQVRYGGYEGPGRLPHAVRAFFANGGRQAWIVRITAPVELDEHGDPVGVARVALPGILVAGGTDPVRLFARSEGRWGSAMTAAFGYRGAPLSFSSATTAALWFAFGEAPPVGSLLRLRFAGDPPQLRFVAALIVEGRQVQATLDAPVASVPLAVELITAELELDDGAGRRELHGGLGLSPDHPRFLATVLCHESALAWPDQGWLGLELAPILDVHLELPVLDRSVAPRFEAGEDRYQAITVDDFFDDDWDRRDERPGEGIKALADAPQVASVVVPDLYHPAALFEPELVDELDTDLGSDDWQRCLELEVPEQPDPDDDADPIDASALANLILDPRNPGDLKAIIAAQRRVIEHGEALGLVALLDVPPGLRQREILAWRQQLSSSWAAAYHPWLRLARGSDEQRPQTEGPMRLGPSAVAAGIIAERELAFGVPHGPANALAIGVVDVEDRVSPGRHDQLHPRGINVFMGERDGVRLTAARTLSADPQLRQLSVRRLMQLLTRALEREMQWVVFEPNDGRLRARLRDSLRTFLRGLYQRGAFRGAREDQAFFVRCDDSNNPRVLGDRGELLVEIGVAPAEPIEFIVLAITRDGDGRLEVAPP